MKRQMIRFFLTLSIMIMLIQPGNVLAKKVKGYKELYTIMAQETSISKNKIKQIIDEAEKKLGVDYTKNRIRQLKIKNPIEIFKLNSNFTAVSFEATDLTKTIREEAIFTLLFQKKRANQVSYTNDYLQFVGKSSIEDYSKINQEKLCESFHKINSNLNCKEEEETQLQFKKAPTISLPVKKEFDTLGKRVDKKADKGHKHDGADITSGVVAEKYIDPVVARDAELASEVAKMKTEVTTVQDKMKSQIDGLKKEMLGKVAGLQKEMTNVEREMKSEVKQVQSGMNRGLSDIKQQALQQKNTGNVNPEYVKKLEKKVAELEKTVKALAAILKDVQRNGDDLIFSGMNVLIQNGTGKTESTNGKGNLIVGYNETRPALNERNGSHNIVVGSQNNFKSYGGIVSGVTNAITGNYASVTGGKQNTASGNFSSVSGGHLNKASGSYSSVSGGLTRSAAGSNSWQGGEYSSKQ